MKDSIDRRVITKEFLLTYFPSPDRYAELTKKPIPSSTLAVSEERYKIVKEKINKAFQGSNTTLSDKH